jgi:hypothetical protein
MFPVLSLSQVKSRGSFDLSRQRMPNVCLRNLFDFQQKVAEIPNRRQQWTKDNHIHIHKSTVSSWLNNTSNVWKAKAKEVEVFDRKSYYTNEEETAEADEPILQIDPYERITFFEDFLENKFNIERELFQREVHKMCVPVLAHLIVGSEWNFIGREIVKRRGWENIVKSLSFFAMAYRRAGKTSSIQQITSAASILIPNMETAIFATSKRISNALGQGVKKMIIEAGYEDMIYKDSEERIILRMNGNVSTERIIFMSPGNPDIYILLCVGGIFSFTFVLLFF